MNTKAQHIQWRSESAKAQIIARIWNKSGKKDTAGFSKFNQPLQLWETPTNPISCG